MSWCPQREVLEEIEKKEQKGKKVSASKKKEVEFSPHTPPQVKSKNVAGPPVYYPPGSAEFTKKEESNAAMSQVSVDQIDIFINRTEQLSIVLRIIMKWMINKAILAYTQEGVENVLVE